MQSPTPQPDRSIMAEPHRGHRAPGPSVLSDHTNFHRPRSLTRSTADGTVTRSRRVEAANEGRMGMKQPGPAALTAAESWGLAQGPLGAPGFDPDVLHTRATDSNGHHETRSIRTPPHVAAEAASLVGKYPEYRSISDVMRDCLVLGMFYRAKALDDPVAKREIEIGLGEISRMQVVENRLAYLVHRKTCQEAFGTLMLEYEKIGAREQMRVALDEFEEAAEDLDEPFRARDLELVEEWRARVGKFG